MKIGFRQVEQKDLVLLRDWANQDRIRKHSHRHTLLNMIDQFKWYKKIIGTRQFEMFMVLKNRNPVGLCGLTHINWKDRSAVISYYLGKQTNPAIDVTLGLEVYEFLKKKAFKEFNLNRLWGEAFSFNEGGIRLALQCGFKKEGIKRQSVFWNGKYWDSIIVGMLAEEYFKSKQ